MGLLGPAPQNELAHLVALLHVGTLESKILSGSDVYLKGLLTDFSGKRGEGKSEKQTVSS